MSLIPTKEQLAFRNYYQRHPDEFARDVLGMEHGFWEKQVEIAHSVRKNRRTAVRSANSLGKTYGLAGIALWLFVCFAPVIIINTAPTFRQVEKQFWKNVRLLYKKAKYNLGGNLLKTSLEASENHFMLGFSADANTIENFQGWHGENIVFIVDEASGVAEATYEAMEGSMTGGGFVRQVLIGNPMRNTGSFAEAFKSAIYNKIHISALDSPNVKAGKTIIKGLADIEWMEEMKVKFGANSDRYKIRVLGEFPSSDEDTIISYDDVFKAMTEPREEYNTGDYEGEYIGIDVARYGGDRTAFVYRKGNMAKVLKIIESSSLMEVAGTGVRLLREYPHAMARVDLIGVGAGVFDRMLEIPDIADRVEGVNVALTADDNESYTNLRAEGWYIVKNWISDAILDGDDEWYQLIEPRYKINSNGKIQVESKADMKKRQVSSPDIADALVLTFTRPTEGGTVAPIF